MTEKKPGKQEQKDELKIQVYTRPVQPGRYPEGLARSIHIAAETEDGTWKPFNRNYGILFAEGLISEENTIVPMGVRNPGIFRMTDGTIVITGERVHESGKADDAVSGKVILWKTRDLIHFEPDGFAEKETLPSISNILTADRDTVLTALNWWSPVVFTGVSVPETIRVRTEKELENVQAQLEYSDGSVRNKRIQWRKETVCFDEPGAYQAQGIVTQESYPFPLAKGYGDPVIFPWEGKWYYISTNDNLDDIGLYVREAETVKELFREGIKEHLILPFSPERGFEQTFWAPEFHVIGGELYILFAVSGHKWGPQCHLMKKKKTGRITDENGWEEPVRVVKKDGIPLAEEAITLDMTFVRAKSCSYMIWSYREHIGTPADSGSMLYVAPVDERAPWQLTGDPVLLSRPLFGWENTEGTINNEGPNAFIKDGMVYLTYSGGSANRYTYAVGLLTADTRSDLLDPRSWRKSITPVLTFYSVEGEYGPGHNSFYMNDEGELMIAYHAETEIEGTLRCDGIRRIHFRKDGSPCFGMSSEEDAGEIEVSAKVIVE